jgi:hypothetical protein
MSSSLYHDNHQNSAPTPGNGLTDAPTKTLRHYGPNFTPLSEYVSSTPDAWPPTYSTLAGIDNTPQAGLAGLPPNKDAVS